MISKGPFQPLPFWDSVIVAVLPIGTHAHADTRTHLRAETKHENSAGKRITNRNQVFMFGNVTWAWLSIPLGCIAYIIFHILRQL